MNYKIFFRASVILMTLFPIWVYAEDIHHSQKQVVKDCSDHIILNSIACGTFSGRVKSLYYSTNNAYFVENLNQNTASIGGFVKYQTQPLYGISAGLSYAGQHRIDSKKHGKQEISELASEKDGLAELYLEYAHDKFKLQFGQQDLDLPFVGSYDWRIMPVLYRALDVQYGDSDNFVRLTGIDRFKSYADDQFLKTSRYSSELETDGMWSIGVGKAFTYGDTRLNTELWYQSYVDYTNIVYFESHLHLENRKFKPDLAVQLMYGKDQGKALAGDIHHRGAGVSIGLSVFNTFNFTTAYNYIKPNNDGYLNGALFAPYMIYTASGPYFAQPFFTSTQDLGAGNALSFALEGNLNDDFYVGARYSFMNLKESENIKALNQSEYVLYGIYSFAGALKGWSISNFMGLATSSRSEKTFLQNRLGLTYTF